MTWPSRIRMENLRPARLAYLAVIPLPRIGRDIFPFILENEGAIDAPAHGIRPSTLLPMRAPRLFPIRCFFLSEPIKIFLAAVEVYIQTHIMCASVWDSERQGGRKRSPPGRIEFELSLKGLHGRIPVQPSSLLCRYNIVLLFSFRL